MYVCTHTGTHRDTCVFDGYECFCMYIHVGVKGQHQVSSSLTSSSYISSQSLLLDLEPTNSGRLAAQEPQKSTCLFPQRWIYQCMILCIFTKCWVLDSDPPASITCTFATERSTQAQPQSLNNKDVWLYSCNSPERLKGQIFCVRTGHSISQQQKEESKQTYSQVCISPFSCITHTHTQHIRNEGVYLVISIHSDPG